MKKNIYMACVLAAGIACGVPTGVHLDDRGMLVVRGVTYPDNGWWSAAGLVAFGPHGEYRAQDQEWGLRQKPKPGGEADFDGAFSVPNAKAVLHEEVRNVDGATSGKKRVSWRLSADGRDRLGVSRAYVFFPLQYPAFKGGTMVSGDAPAVPIPEDGCALDAAKTHTFTTPGGETRIEFRAEKTGAMTLLHDKGKNQFEVRFEMPETMENRESEVAFAFAVDGAEKFRAKEPPPPTIVTNGTEWVRLPFRSEVKDGSILDFSQVLANDLPAGRFGRLVPDGKGHLVREKDGKTVRLIGANLNYGANFLDKDLADKTARNFRRMGYNAVRYHHIDVSILKDGWNAWRSDAIDPEQMDKFDYLFAAMKREGMYATTDLYQMRRFAKGEIEGIDENLDFGKIKGYLPYHRPAFEAWKKFARVFLEHVNPYTGLAYKDDPSLVFICPVNEDSICSVTPESEKSKVWPFFKKAYDGWVARGASRLPPDAEEKQRRMEFMNWAKANFIRESEKFLKNEVGYGGLLTSENWWDLKSQTFLRSALDIVDNHGYADHPEGWPKQRWNQTSNTIPNNFAYQQPVMKAPSRIFGKPFAVTEWNFCAPNKFRAESGPEMGAYAALQDWAAIYRFAWSHDAGRIREPSIVKHFDIVNDPVNQMSERIAVLLFRRGDAAPAKEAICYAVDMDDATRDGKGNMWQRGLFPEKFVTQGFLHRIGSQAVTRKHPLRGKFAKVVDRATAGEALPDLSRTKEDLVSDTGEIVLNRAGRFTVATPRTEAIVAYPRGEKDGAFEAGGLRLNAVDAFQVVSASAMDAKNLRSSKRILLFHLTNVYNSDMLFEGAGMHEVRSDGEMPYLVQAAKAEVEFKSAVKGLRLYAVRCDGKRIREVKTRYADGAYRFTLAVEADVQPVMAYELSAE